MHLRAVDVQGFAGGFSLGVVQAGFELAGKREYPGGFGAPLMEGNRHLLGYDWKLQASDPEEWEPVSAELVAGNPPCSGFSSLSANIVPKGSKAGAKRSDWRGVENPINDCMRALVEFGLRCGAPIVIFESVQGAGKAGRSMMQSLRDLGYEYLTHCFHNNLSCGGYAMRKRYFCVLSAMPFAVEHTGENRATLRDAIGDLEQVALGENGHVILDNASTRRMRYLAENAPWHADEASGAAWNRLSSTKREAMEAAEVGMTKRDAGDSMYAPRRWNYDKPARVVNGTTLQEAVHPVLPRTFTHREVARIMGFPDDWSCDPAIVRGTTGAKWWGKGIPVSSGRWVAEAAHAALSGGQAGLEFGELIGDREYLIDATNWWKG